MKIAAELLRAIKAAETARERAIDAAVLAGLREGPRGQI